MAEARQYLPSEAVPARSANLKDNSFICGADAYPRHNYLHQGAVCTLPALRKLAKMRNAPGTPAGSSRKKERAVKT